MPPRRATSSRLWQARAASMVASCRVVRDGTDVRRSLWVERSRIMARWCADRLTALLTGTLTAVLTDELAGRSGRVFTLRQLTATLTATLTGLLTATLTDPGHSPVNADRKRVV